MSLDISKLSAAELDELIAKAAERRAQLKPDHPLEPPKVVRSALEDPAWYTGPIQTDAGLRIALQVRHYGFGWLTFAMPPLEIAKLMNYWTNALAQAAAGTLVFGAGARPGASGGQLH